MTSRPWYAFYPADYERDTAHLSLLEHGAYRRLMDHYYSTGNLLPTDVDRMCRVCRAQAQAEIDAVAFVLKEFFDLTENGYRHGRIEQELEIARNFSERASKAGTASAAKRQLESNSRSTRAQLDATLETNRSQSQSQSQSQKKEESSSLRSDAPKPKRKSRRSLPEEFPLSEDVAWSEALWLGKGRSDLCETAQDEIAKFRDYHAAQNSTSADWPASWRTWSQNAMKWSSKNGRSNGKQPTAHDKFFNAARSIIEELDGIPNGEGSDTIVVPIGRPLLSQ